MRVLVSAPRKTGGAQLRCLIAAAYGLAALTTRDAPAEPDIRQLAEWLADLPRQSVANVGYPWTPWLTEAASQHGISLVAILRHPFDLFVSNYDVAQQRAARKKAKPEDDPTLASLAQMSLEDTAMLDYARDAFAAEMQWLQGWQRSGTAIVRFEHLEAEPTAALASLAEKLGPLDSATIAHAVDLCPTDNVIVSRPSRGRRMGNLSAGSWPERLPEPLLAVLRQRYSSDVELLGYEVV